MSFVLPDGNGRDRQASTSLSKSVNQHPLNDYTEFSQPSCESQRRVKIADHELRLLILQNVVYERVGLLEAETELISQNVVRLNLLKPDAPGN